MDLLKQIIKMVRSIEKEIPAKEKQLVLRALGMLLYYAGLNL